MSLGTGTQWVHVALWLLCFGKTSLPLLSCHDTSPAGCAARISVEVSAVLPKLQEAAAPSVALRKSGFTPLSTKPALFQEPLLPGTRTYEVRKAHMTCPESCSALPSGDLWGKTSQAEAPARIAQIRPHAMAQQSSWRTIIKPLII